MTSKIDSLGIIGGTGMLGTAIGLALLRSGIINPSQFWLSNRSGKKRNTNHSPM